MTTCLIVDDSRVVRKVARQILDSFGFACSESENGKEALSTCQSALPDVVLLDWNMPVMSGIEFLRELRQLPGGQSPLVMFCTTENDMQHIQEALAAGANEYIMKPFDADIIRSKLIQLGVVDV